MAEKKQRNTRRERRSFQLFVGVCCVTRGFRHRNWTRACLLNIKETNDENDDAACQLYETKQWKFIKHFD